ncbi:MAG: hypothetical protein LIR46_04450 [Bacteroidota bacterium]|nr:hypothetical protein [Bacteroidota bacterium]
MDTMPLGYCVKNCTKDTLFIDLTDSDTLTDDIYWGMHPEDTVGLVPEDTTSVYIHGEKVILYNFYYVLPDSTSGGIYPLDKDTCYIYAIKKQMITRYSLDDIRAKQLYDRRVVTKKDFHDRLFEYRPADMSSTSH